jgi:hypothetical protein
MGPLTALARHSQCQASSVVAWLIVHIAASYNASVQSSMNASYAALVNARKSCRSCPELLNPATCDGGIYDSNQIGPWSLCKGTIRVTSAPGKVSSFEVLLPAAREHPAAGSGRAPVRGSLAAGRPDSGDYVYRSRAGSSQSVMQRGTANSAPSFP